MTTVMRILYLMMTVSGRGGDGLEPTDRLVPPEWRGNPWGPAATAARASGELPPIVLTPPMREWNRWGRATLRDGDILFRLGDARILFGVFPFSRFLSNVTGSKFSHTGVVVFEDGEPYVYDTTKAGVRRQPLPVWVMDNVGPIAVKRLKPEYRDRVPGVIAYLHQVYNEQVPFDYNLREDDAELYCLEMAEKAFRSQGLVLSEPVRLRDMERIDEFPLSVFLIRTLSWLTLSRPLSLDQRVFMPGNTRHGIWASDYLETVYPAPATARAASSLDAAEAFQAPDAPPPVGDPAPYDRG